MSDGAWPDRTTPVWAPAPPWSPLAEPPTGPLADVPGPAAPAAWAASTGAPHDGGRPGGPRGRGRVAAITLLALALGCGATLAIQAVADDDDRATSDRRDSPAASSEGSDIDFVELRGHVDVVHSASFSPDGSMVVTAGSDGRIKVWDAVTGELLSSTGDAGDYVESAVFDRTSSRILAVVDGDVTILDAETGDEEVSIDDEFDVLSATFDGDGSSVVTISFDPADYDVSIGALTVWDADTGDRLSTIDDIGSPEAVSPDGELAVISESDDEGSTVSRVWNLADRTEVSTLDTVQEFVYYADAAAFDEEGTRVARVTSEYVDEEFEGLTSVWDTATGDLITTLDDAGGDHVDVGFDHSGTRVVTTSFGDDFFVSKLALWDASTGERLRVLTDEAVAGYGFSPDDRLIAAATTDSRVTVWDTGTGDEVAVLSGHIGPVAAIDFSPDGSKLVTASADGTARIWDLD